MEATHQLKQLQSVCVVVRQSICTAHQSQFMAFDHLLHSLSISKTGPEAVVAIDSLNEMFNQYGGDEYIIARAYLNQLRNDFIEDD